MKQIIKNYNFNASAHKVTFSDFSSISLDRVLLVTNVSTNSIIYQFNDASLGGSVSGNELTLTKDTSAMSDSHRLQIIYDCASGDPVYDASSGSSTVQGNVAAGTVDSGNPVKIGGKYNSNQFTMSDGQRGDIQLNSHGAVKVTGDCTEITGLSAGALNADLLPSTDVSSFKSFGVQVSGTFSGTLTLQASNDNTNWVSTRYFPASTSNGTAANVIQGTDVGFGTLGFRYFRIRMTAYASGTANGVVELFTSPMTFQSTGVNGTVGSNSNVGSAVPAAAFYLGVKGASGNLVGLQDATQLTDTATAAGSLGVVNQIYNGASFDRLRTPNIFRTATATTSGNTTLWTPTAGKKFRLMRYKVIVTNDAAQSAAGNISIDLRDASTSMNQTFDVFIPATAATTMGGGWQSGWIDLGNGILSAAADNVLNINLNAALTSGKVRVLVAGTQE